MLRTPVLSGALSLLLLSFSVQAEIMVSEAWARSTFKFATSGAAYLDLHNMRSKTIVLTGATVLPEVAAKVEFHETLMEGEMAKMRPIEMPLSLASGERVEFVPGGKHIMLMGLNGPLAEGERFTLTLEFEDGTKQDVSVDIKANKGDEGSHHHHH